MKKIAFEIRARLVETGGRTSQDLGLSKASVSVAVRQLENLGLLRRTWKKGDRKNYYRTADEIGS